MTDMAERVERFRDALFALDAKTMRDGVNRLPRAVSQGLHKAAATPFPALGKLANPATSLKRVRDLPLLSTLADACAAPCLETTLDLLGDSADDPTIEELRGTLPTITEQYPMPMVRLMFASVAISDAVAADKCDEILRDDLPPVDESPAGDTDAVEDDAPTRTSATKETDDEVREARRARRRAQQEEKRKQQEAKARAQQALRDAKRARPASTAPAPAEEPAAPVVEVHRRDAALTPEQSAEFDTDDALVGSVVIAMVPFDDDGGAVDAGPQQKRRPCVVIGASRSSLLVRPCYSEGGLQSRRWQSHPLRDWVAAGLDRATFVEDDARTIARMDAGEPLGRVTDEDWNALW